jgi:hypothetical protein
MPAATAKPGKRVRVALPRGGGRLMRKESAIRVLLDVARQLRFRLELQDGDAASTGDGVRIKPNVNR